MPSTFRTGRHATTGGRTRPVTTVLLLRHARELDRQLAAAQAGDRRGIHRSRVASRRLREALPVMGRPGRLRRKIERDIRRLTRALGAVRELDVAILILDELAAQARMPRRALEDVRAHVIAQRDRRRVRMIERLERMDRERVVRRLTELSGDVPAPDVYDWRDVLDTRIARRARVLGAAIQAAGRIYAPERLHDVRIAVKKLRYALELAADARIAATRPVVATLKRVQETLGRLNDRQVLRRLVAAVQAAPGGDGVDVGGLDVIAGALEEECRHLHARYSKHLTSLFDIVASCRLGVAGPADATEQRRRLPLEPIKMTRPTRPAAARRAG